MRADCETLSVLQDKFFAQGTHALLLIFQAMDGAGKDGTIKHVMSGVDPQGCTVTNFKRPSEKELKHDYLWRFIRELPERGQIGIFNRSYYEEVLVSRVHRNRLDEQCLPPVVQKSKSLWRQRFTQIKDRALWDQYMKAYEDALTHTTTRQSPWHIIPADHRWFSAHAVAQLVVNKLRSLKLHYPHPTDEHRKELEKGKRMLSRE
jgi:polyphosphate kinase 2 (PPK2 family)